MTSTPSRTIGEKVRHEVRELLPVTLFFLLAFELLALTQAMMLVTYGIRVMAFASAALGALVVAKVVVIADHFPFLNRFPHKPLIYNVLWKTAIYFAASVVVRYAEHLIRFWRRGGSFVDANRKLLDEVIWPHVICIQLWLMVLLLLFCTYRELVRALGHNRVRGMFLTNRYVPPPQGPDTSAP